MNGETFDETRPMVTTSDAFLPVVVLTLSLILLFVWQIMKLSGGPANPQVVNEVLKKALES